METFRLAGFRPWLERATRIEDEVDWSVESLKDLDDADDAIADVEDTLQRIQEGAINTTQTNAWMLNVLHDTACERAAKFNVLAIVGPACTTVLLE